MDTLTHLAVGALTPLVFKNSPRKAAVVLFGIVAGELPDIDIMAGTSARAMLEIHRCATHSLPGVLLFSLLLAWGARIFIRRRETRCPAGGGDWSMPGQPWRDWNFSRIWGVALLGLCLHVYLDCMTTFGTQIFWPFSEYRVAVPALFIFDLLFILPLLAAVFYCLRGFSRLEKRKKQLRVARLGILWAILYPLCALGLNTHLTAQLNSKWLDPQAGIQRITLAPMPFSPFIWKAVGESGGEYRLARITFCGTGNPPLFGPPWAKVSPEMWAEMKREVPLFDKFANFVSFPAVRVSRFDERTWKLDFHDLRYAPTGPDDLLHRVGRADGLFIMQVLRDEQSGAILAWRYLGRGQDELDNPPWQVLRKEEQAFP